MNNLVWNLISSINYPPALSDTHETYEEKNSPALRL